MIRATDVARDIKDSALMFGPRAAARLFWRKARTEDRSAESAIHVPVKGLAEGLWIRPRGSDHYVAFQTFRDRDYALEWCPPYRQHMHELIRRTLIAGQEALILDIGANIGASPLLLDQAFPGCRIVAVEPDLENFKMLQRNTMGRKNIVAIRAALWDKPANIAMLHPEHTGWSARVKEAGEHEAGIPGVTIPGLLRQYANARPVIVKADIEGHEVQAFATNNAWADDVPCMMYEQHDPNWPWLGPWQGCGHAYEAMLSRRVRERFHRGETDFAILHPAELRKTVAAIS